MYTAKMYTFVSGVPKVAGNSVTRSGVVIAAAALPTASTSAVCFREMLHPLMRPILLDTVNPSLPLCTASSPSSRAFNFSPSFHSSSAPWGSLSAAAGMLSSTPMRSVQVTRAAVNSVPRVESVHSLTGMVANCFPSTRLCSTSAIAAISPFLNSSPLSDESHSQFKRCTIIRAVPNFSLVRFTNSARPMASSWSLNSMSLDTFDRSSHVTSLFFSSLLPTSQAHAYESVIASNNLHTWHQPFEPLNPGTKPVLTVVLLGWLGSQQKHLKKYADWYNAQGINAVTFTLPIVNILWLSVRAKAGDPVGQLTNQLSAWLAEEATPGQKGTERQLIFHIFSNAGWLAYGSVLEKLSSTENWVERIKGCVVDSAPAADLDPQVWASGFSAALLKKRSSAKSHFAEAALLKFLEAFFGVFLKIPSINDRLSQVITVLSRDQPPCPQLYIYSTADEVIPSEKVESFMETQRQQGRIVKSCTFESSPHVDHFRSCPELYSDHVSNFLQDCLHQSCTKPT